RAFREGLRSNRFDYYRSREHDTLANVIGVVSNAIELDRNESRVAVKGAVPVQLPVDHLIELWPKKFRGVRIGALLHPASVSSDLEHASRILERHNGDLFHLAAFFGPQHGFLGQTQDNMVEWKSYEHPRLHIPVYSLYGEHREPIAEMLKDLDVLLVDLQDVGTRY